jgi:DNA-directed RNA polymerase specialized sigma subunit
MIDPWEMALEHQGLIKSILQKHRWLIDKAHGLMEWEDYWSIGQEALFKAAKSYNPGKGKFSSYAYIFIKGDLIRAFNNLAFPVLRVPISSLPEKDSDLSAMNAKESFTYNVLNSRVDLSAVSYMTAAGDSDDSDSGIFVFFK